MRLTKENSSGGVADILGGTTSIIFTGPLILFNHPTELTEVASKQYVDNKFLSLSANSLKTGILAVERLPAFSGDAVNIAGSNLFNLSPSGVSPGIYPKVAVNAKGLITSGSALSAADIPNFSWGKVNLDRPTTLAGYGITDAIKLSGDSIDGSVTITSTPTLPLHAVNKAYVSELIASKPSFAKVGTVIGYPAKTTPEGFLRTNGGLLDKVTYSALYAVVGDRHTEGNTIYGNGKPWVNQYNLNSLQSATFSWSTSGTIPATLYRAAGAITKDRAFIFGGHNGSAAVTTVYTATIGADGTLGTWSTTTALPVALYQHQVIVTKNYVYILGGQTTSGAASSATYMAPINSSGTLGGWQTGTALPGPVMASQAFVTRNRVYLIGGDSGAGTLSTVYTATIDTNGLIGTWSAVGNIPTQLSASQVIVTKNRVYLLGGDNTASRSAVYTAPIDADGVLGTWSAATSLPAAVHGAVAYTTKTKVYLIGGRNGSTSLSTVYTAAINADGTLGTWTTGTALPAAIDYPVLVASKNKLYLLGGRTGTTALNNARIASISGGMSDYSPYYDGTIIGVEGDKFRLPDYTAKESINEYYYIRY